MAVNLRGKYYEDSATGSLSFLITLTKEDAHDLRSLADGRVGGNWLGMEVVRAMCVAYNDDRVTFGLDPAYRTLSPPIGSYVVLDEGEYVLAPRVGGGPPPPPEDGLFSDENKDSPPPEDPPPVTSFRALPQPKPSDVNYLY